MVSRRTHWIAHIEFQRIFGREGLYRLRPTLLCCKGLGQVFLKYLANLRLFAKCFHPQTNLIYYVLLKLVTNWKTSGSIVKIFNLSMINILYQTKETQRGQKHSVITEPSKNCGCWSLYQYTLSSPRVFMTGYNEENNITKLIKKMTARVSNK